MTRATRRIIFYCAIIIFLAVTYVVLIYAQGYSYSFSERRFIRTGAIYIKVNTDATVLLNGAVTKTTSFLSNSAGLDGLLPGTYTVGVQKQGYSSWQKKVEVQEGFVQDFSRIIILPLTGDDRNNVRKEIQDLLYPVLVSPTPTVSATATPKPTPTPKPSPTPTPDQTAPYFILNGSLYVQGAQGSERIAANVIKVIPSEDGQKIAWFTGGQLWVHWLNDTDYQPYHKAGDSLLLARFAYPIKAAAWFRDNDHIVFDANGFKVIEIDNRSAPNIINL